MCCGQKRTELRNSQAQRTAGPSPNTSPAIAGLKLSGPILRRRPQCRQFRTNPPVNAQNRGVQASAPDADLHAALFGQRSLSGELADPGARTRQRHGLRVFGLPPRSASRCQRRLISVEHTFLPSGLIKQPRAQEVIPVQSL